MRSLYRTIDRADLRDAVALAAAIGVVGASFGTLAAAAGVPPLLTVALSTIVFAGGSQFLVVAVVAAGGNPFTAVLAGLLINARHLPFGLAVGGIVGDRWPTRLLGAHIMIDESVAFARARGRGERARTAYWLVGSLAFVLWNVGTLVGMAAGSAVPDPDAFGVDAAFPAALLALLLPALKAPDARRVGLGAAVAALAATPFLPPGLPVLVGLLGLLAAGRGAPPDGTGLDGTVAADVRAVGAGDDARRVHAAGGEPMIANCGAMRPDLAALHRRWRSWRNRSLPEPGRAGEEGAGEEGAGEEGTGGDRVPGGTGRAEDRPAGEPPNVRRDGGAP